MHTTDLISSFPSVTKCQVRWRVAGIYLLSTSIILELPFSPTFTPSALLHSIQFMLYYHNSKAQILILFLNRSK